MAEFCTMPMCSMIASYQAKNGDGWYCYVHASRLDQNSVIPIPTSVVQDDVKVEVAGKFNSSEIQAGANGGKRQMLPYSLTEIPLEGLRRIGTVFCEGHSKYDRGNWRKFAGDRIMRLEAANHALRHLLLHIHQLETDEDLTGEDDLAKVGWYVVTECEIQRLEKRDAEKKS